MCNFWCLKLPNHFCEASWFTTSTHLESAYIRRTGIYIYITLHKLDMITYLWIWCRRFFPSTVGVREWADQLPATWFQDAFGRVQRDETVVSCIVHVIFLMKFSCNMQTFLFKPQDYGWWYRFPGGLVWWQCRKVRQVYIPMIYRTGIYTYIVRGK